MAEKVLLVDDEQDFVEALAERMEARGMNVNSITSAREALKAVEEETYDAIVLDLQMPEMDGLEVLEAIKEKNPDLQIILLTGHATVEKGVQAMKLGAMDLMEKPADLKALTEKIQQAQANRMVIVEKNTEETIKKILKGKSW
jgi:DNA-binding NtrC family response regulator